MIRAYTGFAFTIDADLLVNDVAIDPAGLTVTAALVKSDRSGLAAGSVVVTCTKPGGTKVRAAWTPAQMLATAPGSYLLEMRTADGPFCHDGISVTLLLGVEP